jgi:hypothetical protein
MLRSTPIHPGKGGMGGRRVKFKMLNPLEFPGIRDLQGSGISRDLGLKNKKIPSHPLPPHDPSSGSPGISRDQESSRISRDLRGFPGIRNLPGSPRILS